MPLVWAAGQSSVSKRPPTAPAGRAESQLTLETHAGEPPDTDEQTIARIRAAIEKAERMQRVAAELLAASRR